MKRKCTRSSNSGQALIVTALVITMLLLSTAYYVFELKTDMTTDQTADDSTFAAIKLSSVNTVISALANVSNRGDNSVLSTDLNMLASTIENQSYGENSILQFTLSNMPPYQNGTWISSEPNETAISSACVSFLINFSGPSTTYTSQYETNVTTALNIEGECMGNGAEDNVNLTCTMFNENEPASISDITVLYQNETGGPWFQVDPSNLQMIDYDNGTYLLSFEAYTQNALQVSVQAHDLRGIFVVANTTFTGA
jgi:hypothetical protein